MTLRSHLYEFLEAKPPAKNHVQQMGLYFEKMTIGLIVISILSFVSVSYSMYVCRM